MHRLGYPRPDWMFRFPNLVWDAIRCGRVQLETDWAHYPPPVEAFSLILQPTIGCPHNRCTICFAYKTKRFRVKKMDEILSDIAEARKWYGAEVAKIFLADGNTIFMRTQDQLEMLGEVKKAFPGVAQIASYAGAKFVLKKSLEDLEKHPQGVN